MRYTAFNAPSEESLALLNIPPYREVLEVGLRGFIHDIFRKKDDKNESELKTKQKPETEDSVKEKKPVAEPEKKPFWQSMKEIFKKKSK
jgi:hypothetical protein